MPRVDQYGTQQPIALLKLFVERKGLYDRGKELTWKNIKDVQVGLAGSSRQHVLQRCHGFCMANSSVQETVTWCCGHPCALPCCISVR
jgi:hypothetical protein